VATFNTSGSFGAHWYGDVDFSVNWQDANSNQSSVHVNLNMRCDSGYSQNATTSYNVRVNGGAINSGSRNINMSGPATVGLIAGDVTVGHDANGYWSGSFGGSLSSSYSGVGSGGGDYGASLPRLAKAPSIAAAVADQIKPTSVRLGTELNDYGHGTSAACRFYYQVHGSGVWLNTSDQGDVGGYNYFAVTGLKAGTTYDYYVLWYNNNGDTSTSGVQTFKTQAVPGIIPVLMALIG
jgi:hypothetical protein